MKLYRDKVRPRGMHRQVINLTNEEVILLMMLALATGQNTPKIDRRLI